MVLAKAGGGKPWADAGWDEWENLHQDDCHDCADPKGPEELAT